MGASKRCRELKAAPLRLPPRWRSASCPEKRVYTNNCQACHLREGQGIPGAFPPLAASDFLNADQARAVAVVLNGLQGPIDVNGVQYDGVMPAVRLSDEEVADVLTYVYSRWGNAAVVVTPEEVRAARP